MPLRLLPAILVILSLAPTALAQNGQEIYLFGAVIRNSRTTLIERDGNGRRARAIPVANSPYAKFTNPA
jgi:hypothetical protein